MILRPSKIFVSFHQLRHYFQTKVSELLVTAQHQQHPPPSTVVTQFRNYSTTQQSILFFSDLQRSLIQKACQGHAMKHNGAMSVNNKVLLNIIQRHFPVLKVFSQPTVHGYHHTLMMTAKQSRTFVSCHPMTYGLPRSAILGLGRMNGLGTSRSFSTGSPGITMFQNVTHQPNVMAHISTRIFSPAVSTKLPQQQQQQQQQEKTKSVVTVNEKKPTFVPFFSSEKDESSSEEGSVFSDDGFQHSPIYTRPNQQMKSFVNLQEQEEETSYVVSEKMTYEDDQKTVDETLGSIVQQDAMAISHALVEEDRTVPNKRNHTKRNKSIIGHDYKKRPSPFLEREVTNIYLMIDLNSILFSPDWTTQSLNASFIKTMEESLKGYQMRILYVLNLLDRLRFSEEPFRVLVRGSELRIYFPLSESVKTRLDAIECLKRLQVIDQDEDCYQIIVERSRDSLSYSFKEVGLDYFQDLQMFLDRTDDLIEAHSPSFLSHSR